MSHDPHARPTAKSLGAKLAAPAIFIAVKAKWLLLVLSKVKFLTTGLSMFVSVGAYALFWGWRFALGFVILLFVHEMGHVWQARREGIAVSAPMFIPFLGAVVTVKDIHDDPGREARIGLAGPILGSAACLVPWAIGAATGENLFIALAFTGFFLNLFNLLPFLPLDGGRAMAAVSEKAWWVGAAAIAVLVVLTNSIIMALILIFGSMELIGRRRARKQAVAQAEHVRETNEAIERQAQLMDGVDDEAAAVLRSKMLPAIHTSSAADLPTRTRLLVLVVYLGLAAALAAGMAATYIANP